MAENQQVACGVVYGTGRQALNATAHLQTVSRSVGTQGTMQSSN